MGQRADARDGGRGEVSKGRKGEEIEEETEQRGGSRGGRGSHDRENNKACSLRVQGESGRWKGEGRGSLHLRRACWRQRDSRRGPSGAAGRAAGRRARRRYTWRPARPPRWRAAPRGRQGRKKRRGGNSRVHIFLLFFPLPPSPPCPFRVFFLFFLFCAPLLSRMGGAGGAYLQHGGGGVRQARVDVPEAL